MCVVKLGLVCLLILFLYFLFFVTKFCPEIVKTSTLLSFAKIKYLITMLIDMVNR